MPIGRWGIRRCRQQRGFTLLELMIVITIVAVLATVASPSFSQYIASQRVKNAAYDLVAALSMTRSEAMTRGAAISLCQGNSGWAGGWTTKADCTAGPALLIEDALPGVAIDTGSACGVLTQVDYGKDGRASSTAGAAYLTKFVISPQPSVGGVKLRCVSLGLSGLPKSVQIDQASDCSC